MRDPTQSPHICFVDPVTLATMAFAGMAGNMFGGGGGGGSKSPTSPAPTPPPAMASPSQDPQAKPSSGATATPSFVGASSMPSTAAGGGTSGQKTLVGQ